MSDLGRAIANAVRVEWTPSRTQAAETGLRVRRRRRAIARGTLVATLGVIAAVSWATWPRSRGEEPVASELPPRPTPEVVSPSIAAPHVARVEPVTPEPVTPTPQSPGVIAKSAPIAVKAKSRAPVATQIVISADSWRDLARRGEFERAYDVLENVRDEPEELLLAADVKRLSHHAAEAVAPLEQILRDHASDPRAPLAAFTLGRVLLEIGRPAEAAAAFARADELAPAGPLAEDAIARRVEALSRAGDRAAAKSLAEQYVARFPAGRKLRSVRRLGGLE